LPSVFDLSIVRKDRQKLLAEISCAGYSPYFTVMTDIDDDLVLSSSTQAALAEFLAEQQAKESKVQSSPEKEEDISIDSFPEDWQA
jgi:hypothetical protein